MLALLSLALGFHDELDDYLAGAGPEDAALAAFPERFDQTALGDWLTHINLKPRSAADLGGTFREMDADADGRVSFQELAGEMKAWFGPPRSGTRADALLEIVPGDATPSMTMTNTLFVSMGTSSTQAYCFKTSGDAAVALSFPQNENDNENERTFSYKGADEMIAVDVYTKAERRMCSIRGGSTAAEFVLDSSGHPDFQHSRHRATTNIGECMQKCAETPTCTAIDYRATDHVYTQAQLEEMEVDALQKIGQEKKVEQSKIDDAAKKGGKAMLVQAILDAKTCRTFSKCDEGDLQTEGDWVAYYNRKVIVDTDLVAGYAKMVEGWRTVCGAAHVVFVNSAGYGVSLPPDPQRFVQLSPRGDTLSGSQKSLDPLIPHQIDKEDRPDKNDGKKLQTIAQAIGGTVWVWPRGKSHLASYKANATVVTYKNPEQTWVSSVAHENGLIWDVGGGSATLYLGKKELKTINPEACGSGVCIAKEEEGETCDADEAKAKTEKLKADETAVTADRCAAGDVDCGFKNVWKHKIKDSMNKLIAKMATAHEGTPEQVETLIAARAKAFAEKLKATAKQATCMGAQTVDVYVTGMLREWFYREPITEDTAPTPTQLQARYAKHFLDAVRKVIRTLEKDGLTPGKVEFLKHEFEAKQEAAEFLQNGLDANEKVVNDLAAGYTDATKT